MRRLFSHAVLAAAACLAAAPAHAQSVVAQDALPVGGPYTVLLEEDDRIIYMAHGSIRRSDGVVYVTSILAVDTERMNQNGGISRMDMANEINCAANTTRVTHGSGYYPDGRHVGNTPGQQSWNPIAANSPVAEVHNIVCNGGRPQGRVLGDDPNVINAEFRARS